MPAAAEVNVSQCTWEMFVNALKMAAIGTFIKPMASLLGKYNLCFTQFEEQSYEDPIANSGAFTYWAPFPGRLLVI